MRLFPPRGPLGRFPHFKGLIAALRLLAIRPASLRLLRSAVLSLLLSVCVDSSSEAVFVLSQQALISGQAHLYSAMPSAAYSMTETARSPTFPYNPYTSALLSDPDGTFLPGHYSIPVLLPLGGLRKLPFCRVFRGSITRLLYSLSTLHT